MTITDQCLLAELLGAVRARVEQRERSFVHQPTPESYRALLEADRAEAYLRSVAEVAA